MILTVENILNNLKSGNLKETEKACLTLLGQSEYASDILMILGVVSVLNQKGDEGIAYLLQANRNKTLVVALQRILGKFYLDKGDYDKATAFWKNALAIEPDNAHLHYDLGVALQKQNHHEQAVFHYNQAIQYKTDFAEAYCNLGLAFFKLDQFEKAIEACEIAIRINPRLALAYENLGLVFFTQNKYDEAKKTCYQSLGHLPDHPSTYLNLGLICQKEGKYQDAIEHLEKALSLKPDLVDAHFLLGSILSSINQLERAISCYKRVLQLAPYRLDAINSLANAFKQQGDMQRALKTYHQALSVDPAYFPALNNAGLIFQEPLLRPENAISYFQRAIQSKPHSPVPYEHLGDALINLDKLTEGVQAYDKAIERGARDAVQIKRATVLPRIPHSTEEVLFWRKQFLNSVRELQHANLKIDNPAKELGARTFYLAYHGINNIKLVKEFGRLVQGVRPWHNVLSRKVNKKPRIGFISQFFYHGHTINKVFLELIDKLSKDKFDVVLFVIGNSQKLPLSTPHQQVNLPIGDLNTACETVAQANLDILFYTDIGMDSLTYYLAFNRLAPVQCATWGHPCTTGIETIDYYISSQLFESPNAQEHYTEQLHLISGVPTYYSRPVMEDAKVTKDYFGFSAQDHLYLCPQTFIKFHPDFDEVLASILRQDSQGTLVLANAAYRKWSERLKQRFSKTMPDVLDRVRFFDKLSYPDFMKLLKVGDVMLDTLYFGGGSTIYESFAVGTPVVTLPTQLLSGRMAYGLYQKMGVLDCIAPNTEDYVQLSLKLANEPDFRESARQQILASNEVLFEDISAVKELEGFFSQIIEER